MRLSILAFAAGVLALQIQGELPGLVLLSALALASVAGFFVARNGTAMPARSVVVLSCVVLGFVWAGGRAQIRLADHLPEAWEGQDVELVGVVAALPQRFAQGERFVFDVEQAVTPGAQIPHRISLSWYRSRSGAGEIAEDTGAGQARSVRPGERWRFTVRLKRPHGNANPQGFDFEAWLLERGIRATGSIRARSEAVRLDDFVWRPAYAVEALRDRLRERFVRALPDAPYTGVLTALAIGDQRSIPVAQWQVFSRTGVMHLVSISGLHVTMIAALCALAVGTLWRRSERLMLRLPAQKAAIAAGWAAAFFYASLAGFEVPAQRTLYMLSVLAVALWAGRNLGVVRTLLLALLVVLLIDPWAVLATGFWLSFGAVAILFYAGNSRLGPNEPRRWRGVLIQWGAAQWAVTVGGLPLLLLFFQQFSLVSPLANLVAVPVVTFVVTPLALIFAVIPWPPLLHLDHWVMVQLMALLDWLAAWPVWQQAAPPLWAVLLALVGVVWLLLPRGFPARWLGLCLLLPALFPPLPRPGMGEAWADVLDVGQGLAVVVRTARHALLYDTGPGYGGEADAGQRVVVPFLRTNGVAKLDALVVSHRDQDHSGGLVSVRAHAPVGRILASFAEAGGERCAAGQSWEWDGVRFTMLHPESDNYEKKTRTNAMSCVLRVESVGASLLLPADIEAANERALVARAAEALRADVLVVPHHGGKGSSTPEFVSVVAPEHAVFSAGYRNPFGHPRPEILARYGDSSIWRTDRDGAVRVVLGEGAEVTVWRAERRRYWQHR
ncbi:DNA internalization-related competence protein ComEC/Rec2 [Propionivibrio sp.]|uniref:DNA internalization-related competence protein ComEC/Rec2 n=1 Tax=Propionivibrio sp. TaxID=2212460 RepID=UPI00272EADC5|nr:DNA internalization-related competence protein ComEC/Rec2 [Propionivibrio sp.]